MIVVSNTSPIIALSRIQRLDIFDKLFWEIYITEDVLSEALPSGIVEEFEHIKNAVDKFIFTREAKTNYPFRRKIQQGEQSVLNLALDLNADILIIDDRKARNEAKEMNLNSFLAYTTDILKLAEQEQIIGSYAQIEKKLRDKKIFLPSSL